MAASLDICLASIGYLLEFLEVVGLIETGQAACLGTRSLGVTVEGFDSGVK